MHCNPPEVPSITPVIEGDMSRRSIERRTTESSHGEGPAVFTVDMPLRSAAAYLQPVRAIEICEGKTDHGPSSPYAKVIPFTYPEAEHVHLFASNNYHLPAMVVPDRANMLRVSAILDTGAGPNLVSRRFVRSEWTDCIKPYKGPGLTGATRTSVGVDGVILLNVTLGDLHVRCWFGVVTGLATNLLLGTSFIERFVSGIFPLERRVVPRHSRPVPIEAGKEVERREYKTPLLVVEAGQDDVEF